MDHYIFIDFGFVKERSEIASITFLEDAKTEEERTEWMEKYVMRKEVYEYEKEKNIEIKEPNRYTRMLIMKNFDEITEILIEDYSRGLRGENLLSSKEFEYTLRVQNALKRVLINRL